MMFEDTHDLLYEGLRARQCVKSPTGGILGPNLRLPGERESRFMYISEVGGGEYVVAPTGKSFRFVRACERAGARAARDQLTVT